MKRLTATLLAPLAAMLLLSSCLHKANATKFYTLEPAMRSGETMVDITPTSLYQTQEMRYITPEGEVVSIPGCRWAMPLQKLLETALGKDTNYGARASLKVSCRLTSILWKAGDGFTLSGENFVILERPVTLEHSGKNGRRNPGVVEYDVQEPQAFQIFLPCPKKPDGAALRGILVQGVKQIVAQSQGLAAQAQELQAAKAGAETQPKTAPDSESQTEAE